MVGGETSRPTPSPVRGPRSRIADALCSCRVPGAAGVSGGHERGHASSFPSMLVRRWARLLALPLGPAASTYDFIAVQKSPVGEGQRRSVFVADRRAGI